MWLINSIRPDHGTIAGFVANNKKSFSNCFKRTDSCFRRLGLNRWKNSCY